MNTKLTTFRITSCDPRLTRHSRWFKRLGAPIKGFNARELGARLKMDARMVNSCPGWAFFNTDKGSFELEWDV
jgi:hypothetical protein